MTGSAQRAAAAGSAAASAIASDTQSYGTIQQPPSRPQLLTRARSETAATGGGLHQGDLVPSATLRQSGSLRALFRLTSTVGADSAAAVQEVSPKAPPAAPPLRQVRSQNDRDRRRVSRETVPLLRRSITTSQIPPLVRAMSSMLRLPREEEKFRCHICFDDDVPVSEAVTLSSCGHRYCTACFKAYLEIKIREGNVYPVCFHPIEDPARKTCGAAVDAVQIKGIVVPEVWKKFNLFRFNKEHEHARECPHCAFSQDYKGAENPQCVCEQCGKIFCFFHDIAHEGGSCADYELQTAESESMNRAKIQEIAKPCPGCTRDVEKDGGCNHMKCVVCQTSFCWLCGETIDDEPMPSHFSSSSDSPCSGKQFDGDDQVELPWQLQAYAVCVGFVCYPFAVLCAAVATPFAWCLSASDESSFSDLFWRRHTVAMIWLALLVSLVFFLAAIVVELTYRLVVFVVMLPFVIIKNIATKAVGCCCCRPRRERLPSTVEARADNHQRLQAHDLEAGLPQPLESPMKAADSKEEPNTAAAA